MAKSKEKTAPASTLERAWDAFERGDAVTARSLASKVSASPSEEDEAAAQKLGLKILEPVPSEAMTARVVAEMCIRDRARMGALCPSTLAKG